MATQVALTAEESGKIVSASFFMKTLKSYLPTHGTFFKVRGCELCIFADTTRTECAEAKIA